MNISKDARRYIVDNLIAIGYCFGANGRAYDFFNKFMTDLVDLNGIARHYDRFGDWDINRLLYTEADLLDISDELFCRKYPIFLLFVLSKNIPYDLSYETTDYSLFHYHILYTKPRIKSIPQKAGNNPCLLICLYIHFIAEYQSPLLP